MDFNQILCSEIEAFELERNISQQEPYQRPYKDYFKTTSLFEKSKNESNLNDLKVVHLKQNKHVSLKQLSELEQIKLKDMYVNQIHYGKYLLCRSIVEPFLKTGLNLLIEDQDEQIENVLIYNLVKSYDSNPTNYLPNNTVLIIKEPNLKIMPSNQHDFYIEINSPSDLIILENSPIQKWTENSQDFETLNRLGNQHFVQKEFEIAVKYYTMCLNIKQDYKILNNRAQCYLNLEKFNLAKADCESSLKLESVSNEKAFFRMGKCLYSMRQFEKALEYFENCFKINNKNSEVLKELNRTKSRIEEAQSGAYDFKNIIEDCRNGILRHDVADYVSPHVEFIGKSLKAKDYIKRGDLIIGVKASCIFYEKESKLKTISINLNQKKIESNSKTQNLLNLIYKLNHNTYLLEQVYKLIEPECDLNSSIIDVSKIESFLSTNSFKSEPLEFYNNFDPVPNELEKNSGLWTLCARIQHSCLPNTKQIFFNDFLTLYALHDIEQGEEITMLCVNNLEPYSERTRILSTEFNFTCDCELCVMDRVDPNTSKRDLYYLENKDRIKKLALKNGKDIKQGKEFYYKLKELYSDRERFNYLLALPLVYLGMFYRNLAKLDKSAQIYLDLFELCKDHQEYMAFYGIAEAINDHYIWFELEKVKDNFRLAKHYSVGADEYFLLRCDAKIIDYESILNLIN